MHDPLPLNREILYNRHRLSHQQIDDFLGEKESRNYIAEKLEQLVQLKEFLGIAEAFTASGIEFIPLKGALLSYRIFNDATYRRYNDLDFLIGIPSIENAVEVLKKRGYHTPVYDLPADECRREMLYQHMNEILLYNPEKDIGVDLHWELFTGGKFIKPQTLKEIIAYNQEKVVFQGRQFNVLSIEFELLYLVIHGGLHAWRRLKWLVDIKELLQRVEYDEKAFIGLTKKMNAQHSVALCNELLKIYFPDSRLLPSLNVASKYSLNFALYSINMEKDEQKQSVREYLKTTLYNSTAFPGINYKLSMLQQTLFASDLAANKWMPCSNFLYYLVSPFWKIWRGFR